MLFEGSGEKSYHFGNFWELSSNRVFSDDGLGKTLTYVSAPSLQKLNNSQIKVLKFNPLQDALKDTGDRRVGESDHNVLRHLTLSAGTVLDFITTIFGAIVSQDIVKKNTVDARMSMVGLGAQGCEFLKCVALVGVSCYNKGKFTISASDIIEDSNHSRHLRFCDWNMGQAKSMDAAIAACSSQTRAQITIFTVPDSPSALLLGIPLRPLETNSIPPPKNNIGWCIHAFINSSSLEDHISCRQHRLEEGAIVLSESINGVAVSISFSSLLQPDYNRKSLQDAIWHFPSLDLLEWYDDVQAAPCHAIRDTRSSTDPVRNVLNMFEETATHYLYSGKRGYQTLLRFLLLNVRCWLEKYKYVSFHFGVAITFQIVNCVHNSVHQMEGTVLMALLQQYKGIADFLQAVASKKDQTQF